MAELIFDRSGEPLVRLPIDRDRFQLGHADDNDLVLPPEAASAQQALVELRSDGWHLIDLSGEGTRVDDALVREAMPLTDGARLTLREGWGATWRLGPATAPGETRRAASGGNTVAGSGPSEVPDGLRLRWTAGGRERTLAVEGEVVSIGTDDGNAVVLDDEFASAFHARIIRKSDGWHLRDLGSTNGTAVGGVSVTEARLAPGSSVTVGRTELVLERDASMMPAARYGIVTGDPGLREVLLQVERIADSDATVTIFGESGTGKELVARALHEASDRAGRPYIPVNCAAISPELIESELFGHEKGAFTGAASARRGAFEEASGGTLFLDEVGELPLDLQAKLLRALELKEIRRVGSSRPIQVDVRIVAATNRDLHKEVTEGRFREDLFYRLFVVPLTLPPLRRRRGDIALLAHHFVEDRSPRRTPPQLTEAALAKLEAHAWPGNVRELKNTLERAMLLGRGAELDADDISFAAVRPLAPEDGSVYVVDKTLDQIANEAILINLKAHGGNRRLTAKALGMARSTLQLRLKDLGVVKPEGEEST